MAPLLAAIPALLKGAGLVMGASAPSWLPAATTAAGIGSTALGLAGAFGGGGAGPGPGAVGPGSTPPPVGAAPFSLPQNGMPGMAGLIGGAMSGASAPPLGLLPSILRTLR